MKKPDCKKSSVSLALAGLFFGGFGGAQADSFNEWGFWAGSGAPGGRNDNPGGDDAGGGSNDGSDQSGPLGDDIFDQFERDANLALNDAGMEPEMEPEPNPFAFTDPPAGTWDVYASVGYGELGGDTRTGIAATGSMVLSPSTVSEGTELNGDGDINLTLQDMDNPMNTGGINTNGETEGYFVGNGVTGDQFVPIDVDLENGASFGTLRTEGENGDPGDVADAPDFFADGSIEGAFIDPNVPCCSGSDGVFVAGQRTPSADLQALNVGNVAANYQGSTFYAEHSVSVDVNFGGATPSWTGNFANGALPGHEGSHDFTAAGGFNAQGNGVSNSVGGDLTAGTVVFSFFGASATHLGGNVNGTGPGGFENGETIIVRDTFSALKDGPVIPGGFLPPPM